MSFITSSYFIGEIAIPNASSESSLTAAIAQYEKELLISLLGYKLYSLLIADLDMSGDAQTQKYIDLVEGKEFTHIYKGDEYTIKWEGLTNTVFQSPIAYYVFYKFVERDVTRLYGSGVSMATVGEGWQRVSPVNKLINAWERMRELYGRMPAQYNDSGPLRGTNLNNTYDLSPSSYNFLVANKDDYPDWIFTPIRNINAFNI